MRRFCCIIFFLLQSLLLTFAAEPLLIYFQNRSGGLRLVEPGQVVRSGAELKFGMNIKIGTTILTEKNDSVELKLPNGSIIRIHENTNFTIIAIQGEKGATKNEFELQVGKFRAVVGKIAGDEQYNFRSGSTLCGVRGTDTGMEALPDPNGQGILAPKVFVFGGLVEVSKLDEKGNPISSLLLKSGEWVDTSGISLLAQQMTKQMLDYFKSGLEFEKLNPQAVPGHTLPLTQADTENREASTSQETTSDWAKALSEFLGLEIGTITLGNQTYGKAIFAPKIKLDNFKIALYLPIIYQSNMFDPADWYQPAGNNEWSFGTDPAFGDDWPARIGDAIHDLVLKIKGLEINQLRDPFHLKLGSLSSFSLGHGMLVSNYANDSDFPAIRKIGLELGLDTGAFGLELLTDDLATTLKLDPDILGTRIYFRPFLPSRFALGLSLVADLNPVWDVPNLGDPIIITAGLDLDLPLVESEIFSLILFTDFAILLPYFRSEVIGTTTIPQGFAFNAIWYEAEAGSSFRNFGIAAGLLGNISLFTWRVEARYYNGKFRPALFNSLYDRIKLDYVKELIDYLQNPSDKQNNLTTFGIYGEGGFALEKIFAVNLGYLCPLVFSAGGLSYGDDYLRLELRLEKNVIPLIGLYGSIAYERRKFISSFAEGLPALFDKNTVIKTTIGYPLTKGLDLIFNYTTTFIRDPLTGEITFNHAFTFETVIDF